MPIAIWMASAPTHRESHLRSIFKGLTWRTVATGTTVAIAWSVTGKVDVALEIGSIEVFAKIAIYYVHERAWQLVPRGTIRRMYEPGSTD